MGIGKRREWFTATNTEASEGSLYLVVALSVYKYMDQAGVAARSLSLRAHDDKQPTLPPASRLPPTADDRHSHQPCCR